MFIALEGIDACGKSVQAKLLADRINADIYTFPDYETPVGQLILGHLKGEWQCIPNSLNGPTGVDAMAFQSLHFTNRLEMQAAIDLSLQETGVVVADRYLGSSLAYGAADCLDWKYLLKVQASLIQPDYNILIDAEVQDSVDRRPYRQDRYERNLGFQRTVARNYRAIWSEMSSTDCVSGKGTKWVVVDGRKPREETHEEIFAIVDSARKDAGLGWVCQPPRELNNEG